MLDADSEAFKDGVDGKRNHKDERGHVRAAAACLAELLHLVDLRGCLIVRDQLHWVRMPVVSRPVQTSSAIGY